MVRKHQIDRIQAQIDRLGDRAAALLDQEHAVEAELADRRSSLRSGRLRTARHARAIRRAEAKLERLRAERVDLVEQELQAVMVALEKQSRRTRQRLDEELERLAPVEAEWDRLRGTFEALEQAVGTPAIGQLAGPWTGELEIPEFPVHEREEYTRPFPARALLF
jgi:chromosome segregation ATPase